MPAVYPVSVKSFLPRTDNIDTVWAAHVNDLQNEVSAVERTVGVRPADWAGYTLPPFAGEGTPPPDAAIGRARSYASVADRLNVLQRQITWLTTMTIRDANDLEPGAIRPDPPVVIRPPRSPVARIRASGGPVTAGANSWTTFRWTAADYDPFRIFQGGTNLTCPQTGFWLITAQVKADPPPRRANDFHFVHSIMTMGSTELAGQDSLMETADGTFHRLNLTWSGVWRKGQQIQVRVSQHGATSSSVDANCGIGLIFCRET